MQRPTWVTVVGILMIFFGGCGGVPSDLKQIKTEALIELHGELVDEIQKEFGTEFFDSTDHKALVGLGAIDPATLDSDTLTSQDVAETIKSLADMTPTDVATIVKHGYIGLAVSILYIMTGVLFLFIRKKFVINVVLFMLVLSLGFVVFQALEINKLDVSKLFSFGLQVNIFFGAIIDTVFLILILILDKSYFSGEYQGGDYYDEVETT